MVNAIVQFIHSKYVLRSSREVDYDQRFSQTFTLYWIFLLAANWYGTYKAIPTQQRQPTSEEIKKGFQSVGFEFTSTQGRYYSRRLYGVTVRSRFIFGIKVELCALVEKATTFLALEELVKLWNNQKTLLFLEKPWPRGTLNSGKQEFIHNANHHDGNRDICKSQGTKGQNPLIPKKMVIDSKGNQTWKDSKRNTQDQVLSSSISLLRFVVERRLKIREGMLNLINLEEATRLVEDEISRMKAWINSRQAIFLEYKKKLQSAFMDEVDKADIHGWWRRRNAYYLHIILEWHDFDSVNSFTGSKRLKQFKRLYSVEALDDNKKKMELAIANNLIIETASFIQALLARIWFTSSHFLPRQGDTTVRFEHSYVALLAFMNLGNRFCMPNPRILKSLKRCFEVVNFCNPEELELIKLHSVVAMKDRRVMDIFAEAEEEPDIKEHLAKATGRQVSRYASTDNLKSIQCDVLLLWICYQNLGLEDNRDL